MNGNSISDQIAAVIFGALAEPPKRDERSAHGWIHELRDWLCSSAMQLINRNGTNVVELLENHREGMRYQVGASCDHETQTAHVDITNEDGTIVGSLTASFLFTDKAGNR